MAMTNKNKKGKMVLGPGMIRTEKSKPKMTRKAAVAKNPGISRIPTRGEGWHLE